MDAMRKVIDFENAKILDVNGRANGNMDGFKIKKHITDIAWKIRAFTNCRHELEDYLDATIEKLPCFELVLQRFNDLGRATACNCSNECPLMQRLIVYVGLAIDFVSDLRKMNLEVTLQQIIGTNLTNHFADNFLLMDRESENHLIPKTDSLPSWANLSEGRSKAIFRAKSYPITMIFKKGSR